MEMILYGGGIAMLLWWLLRDPPPPSDDFKDNTIRLMGDGMGDDR